jgi:hypothetical protein
MVKKTYLDRRILLDERVRILVSLMRPRQYRVQVVRQDSGGAGLQFGLGVTVATRRGSGIALDLPAYENDVLNALNRSGGLPGSDALNEVYVERELKTGGTKITHLPLRLREGEQIPFTLQDVILQDGDLVFIEARDTEVFYTGGILVPRQYFLPRDYDLRVSEAISLAGGPLVNGLFSTNNLAGNVAASGLGSPNPSRVTVLRRTKLNGRIPIIVNLNKALNDPKEDIIIQGGDMIIYQETLGESFTRYMTDIFRINIIGTFIRQRDATGTATFIAP